jgi:hypothetical protein
MQGIAIWHVRRINKDGVYHPHLHWLVRATRPAGFRLTDENIKAEIATVLRLVRDNFDDGMDNPLEDDTWSLDVEIVEFCHGGGHVATL